MVNDVLAPQKGPFHPSSYRFHDKTDLLSSSKSEIWGGQKTETKSRGRLWLIDPLESIVWIRTSWSRRRRQFTLFVWRGVSNNVTSYSPICLGVGCFSSVKHLNKKRWVPVSFEIFSGSEKDSEPETNNRTHITSPFEICAEGDCHLKIRAFWITKNSWTNRSLSPNPLTEGNSDLSTERSVVKRTTATLRTSYVVSGVMNGHQSLRLLFPTLKVNSRKSVKVDLGPHYT